MVLKTLIITHFLSLLNFKLHGGLEKYSIVKKGKRRGVGGGRGDRGMGRPEGNKGC